MKEGKKSVAERIVYDAFAKVSTQLNEPDVLKVFYKALDNARPRLEVKPRRVGGATYRCRLKCVRSRDLDCLALDQGFRRYQEGQAHAGEACRRDTLRL